MSSLMDKCKQIQIPSINGRIEINLFERFNEFRTDHTLCDVIIQCDDKKKIYAHKLILSAISPYFAAMFQSNMVERNQQTIRIKGVESQSMESLINFAYTSKIIISLENIFCLLAAANMLCFVEVENSCIDFLCKSLDISNCIDICSIAERIHCETLYTIATLYVTSNFRQLIQNESFKNLSPMQFESILMQNEINVSSESEVYEAAMKWVAYDTDSRIEYLSNLLKHVRFCLMSRKYLMDRVLHDRLIMQDEKSRDVVLKALDYYLLPERNIDNEITVLPRHVSNRTLYVLGGQVKGKPRSSAESYDFLNKRWQPVTAMLTPRKNVAAIVLEGFLYAVGGLCDTTHLDTVEKYDPTTEVWTQVATLKQCKGALAVTVLDGWLYALGGSNGRDTLTCAEQYDALIDKWTPLPTMRLPRSYFDCTELNGKIYAIGGYCGISEIERCECFDPVSNKWSEITGMNKSRMHHGAITCNKRIYVFGGKNSMGLLNSIEKYNPDLNMWLIIKSKVTLNHGASISLGFKPNSNNDEVVILGGINHENYEELHDVRTLEVKSPDYQLKTSVRMLEERSYAGTALM